MWEKIVLFLLSWLHRPLFWWVRAEIVPAPLAENLALNPALPVCYVMPRRSLIDRLVLEYIVHKEKLPRPFGGVRRLPQAGEAACVYLPELGRENRPKKNANILRLVDLAASSPEYDLQIVPFMVFWGRGPEKENSFFKILFSDNQQAQSVRKLFIALVNGRSTLVNFSQVMSFKTFSSGVNNPAHAAQKFMRILRVHFRRQQTATQGPVARDRSKMLHAVLANPRVKEAIRLECEEKNISPDQARRQALKYADEIAADFSIGAIRLFAAILNPIWNRIYSGLSTFHVQRLRETAQTEGIVYLASHRSHLDYLLHSYVLYKQGLATPHIAAGDNLNFWPVGLLFRRSGAFFLRRKFTGLRLYSEVFRSYLDVLLTRKHSILFFPEGGRSRTGRLLNPKPGMLGMTVQSFLSHPDNPVNIVPVYIGYDRVPEVNSYFKEISGKQKKQKEGIGGLVRAGKILQSKHGQPYLSYGQPIKLKNWMDENVADWRTQIAGEEWQAFLAGGKTPNWFKHAVTNLGNQVMYGINAAVVVNPTALVASILFASRQRALGEDELTNQINLVLSLHHAAPYSGDTIFPLKNAAEIIHEAESVGGVRRVPHAWGDMLYLEGKPAVQLTYVRNNIQHILILPALIATCFVNQASLRESELLQTCHVLYPLLQREWSLRWNQENLNSGLINIINALVEAKILERQGDVLYRAAQNTTAYGQLWLLARSARETFERYAMTIAVLVKYDGKQPLRRDIEAHCQQLAERLAILTGRNTPEFFDKSLFSQNIDALISEKLLEKIKDQPDNLAISPRLQTISSQAMALVEADARLVILQLSAKTPLEAG